MALDHAGAVPAAANDLASPLSVVSRFWTEFDLETVRSKLDEVGL
eukprot:CAMPEP_0202910802 /NCGR_PEP_ID=MMETSP1392-20130828/53071_1 /ASSEMBLY_ACC=CAM_ASM_000868 /TAXON_ID=225041 /ORGANISM="Chlamydomonas chlamydogama, Strain SAG 11-48b" /LENGTH=44 /DNA_ID= /DNA_START= /DNA_END= /DNA_ORIENTATION=